MCVTLLVLQFGHVVCVLLAETATLLVSLCHEESRKSHAIDATPALSDKQEQVSGAAGRYHYRSHLLLLVSRKSHAIDATPLETSQHDSDESISYLFLGHVPLDTDHLYIMV